MSHRQCSTSGFALSSEGTSTTTAFPRTRERSSHFGVRSNVRGNASCNGGASAHGGTLSRPSASRLDIRCRSRASFTPGPASASLARKPKVGARCGKSARRALSGGRPEGAVPTGTGGPWVSRTWQAGLRHRSRKGGNSHRKPKFARPGVYLTTAQLLSQARVCVVCEQRLLDALLLDRPRGAGSVRALFRTRTRCGILPRWCSNASCSHRRMRR
jgi:hypothetical protein